MLYKLAILALFFVFVGCAIYGIEAHDNITTVSAFVGCVIAATLWFWPEFITDYEEDDTNPFTENR